MNTPNLLAVTVKTVAFTILFVIAVSGHYVLFERAAQIAG